jgi:ATP-dependent Clp protease, protease subunit
MARSNLSNSSTPTNQANQLLGLLTGEDEESCAEERLWNRGIFYLTGEIGPGDTLPIQFELLEKLLDPSYNGEVQILINSPGGILEEGWALLDLMELAKTKFDIRVVGIGEVASLATMILAAGTPGKRLLAPNASVMVHEFSTSMGGKYSELLSQGQELDRLQSRLVAFWKQHSKCTTKAAIEKHILTEKDTWLDVADCLKFGLVDSILKL